LYAGIKYFNRFLTVVNDPPLGGKGSKRRVFVERDRAEWIAVKVPAIVTQELFDTVQARLQLHEQRYRQPDAHYLLSGLVACGECGCGCSSYRRYLGRALAGGGKSVHHKSAYRCNWRAAENTHDRQRIERCHNPEIATHILEGAVFDMIRDAMLDPQKLRECIEVIANDRGTDHFRVAQDLARIAASIKAIDDERKRLIEQYASDQMAEDTYISANRGLDARLAGLRREKSEVISGMKNTGDDQLADMRTSQFCERAKTRLEACSDFDSKRRFLVEHIEKVIFRSGKVTVVGSVPIPQTQGENASLEPALQFRIEAEIGKTVRSHRKWRFVKAEVRSSSPVSDEQPSVPSVEPQRLGQAVVMHNEATV
jgi:hypothetical protein